jgi:hypothetical protein
MVFAALLGFGSRFGDDFVNFVHRHFVRAVLARLGASPPQGYLTRSQARAGIHIFHKL